MEENKPENTQDTGRNPDGTWKKGFCPNPGGRKKNPLKEFSLAEFNSWTDEQKREFLAMINPIDRWKMTEGSPQTDITSGGEKIEQIPIYAGKSIQEYPSDQKDIPIEKKD